MGVTYQVQRPQDITRKVAVVWVALLLPIREVAVVWVAFVLTIREVAVVWVALLLPIREVAVVWLALLHSIREGPKTTILRFGVFICQCLPKDAKKVPQITPDTYFLQRSVHVIVLKSSFGAV